MGRRKTKAEPEPKIGHNGGPLTEDRRKQLAGYVSEIERCDREIASVQEDRKAMFESAKDAGFDTKAMRKVLGERKQDREKRQALEAICDAYRHALGMLADTPLGDAAIARDLRPTAADTSDRPFAPA